MRGRKYLKTHLVCLYFLDNDFVVNFEIYDNFIDEVMSDLSRVFSVLREFRFSNNADNADVLR